MKLIKAIVQLEFNDDVQGVDKCDVIEALQHFGEEKRDKIIDFFEVKQ